ncbi:MAG: argininosuccinate synthase [Planctomycetota bacterium]|nr:MAG: argininosuccinate synthase [Planctomycetota bacterium]
MKRVILAYSGGLDTSAALHWLKHERNYKVSTFYANVGQHDDVEAITDRALSIGADGVFVEDLRKVFIEKYCMRALMANAERYDGSILAGALSRPLITYELVKRASHEGCEAIAHGGTLGGNDTIRFEIAAAALAPELQVIAPHGEWPMKKREDLFEYTDRHGIEIPRRDVSEIITADQNLWGASFECVSDSHCLRTAGNNAFFITTSLEEAPSQPATIKIGFNEGLPVSLDGEDMSPLDMVNTLNELGAAHSIGRGSGIENRLIGDKVLKFHEHPAAAILFAGHRAMEDATISKSVMWLSRQLSNNYAELVFNGLWFSDLREALDAFFRQTQKYVTGSCTVQIHKGKIRLVELESPYSLLTATGAASEKDKEYYRQATSGYSEVIAHNLRLEAKRRKRIF